MSLNILVTGSDGFLGNHLVKKLRLSKFKPVNVDVHPLYTDTIKLDVADEDFTQYFTKYDFDVIYHLGSACSILQYKQDPLYHIFNTLSGLYNVLELAERCSARVILPSSGNVYGNQQSHCRETQNPVPRNLYGHTKRFCEMVASFSNVETITLRIFCSYGYGEEKKDKLGSVIYQFLRKMIVGKSPVIWGDGTQTRDFIHVDNVIDCLYQSMSIDNVPYVNIASGVSFSYNDVVQIMNYVLDKQLSPVYTDKPSDYVEKTFADVSLMKSIFNVKLISLEEGLRQFMRYLRLMMLHSDF